MADNVSDETLPSPFGDLWQYGESSVGGEPYLWYLRTLLDGRTVECWHAKLNSWEYYDEVIAFKEFIAKGTWRRPTAEVMERSGRRLDRPPTAGSPPTTDRLVITHLRRAK